MTPQWSKLLSREGVDATTMSGADIYFIDSVRKFTRTKQELFFTYFQGKKFSHYIGVDSQALGRFKDLLPCFRRKSGGPPSIY